MVLSKGRRGKGITQGQNGKRHYPREEGEKALSKSKRGKGIIQEQKGKRHYPREEGGKTLSKSKRGKGIIQEQKGKRHYPRAKGEKALSKGRRGKGIILGQKEKWYYPRAKGEKALSKGRRGKGDHEEKRSLGPKLSHSDHFPLFSFHFCSDLDLQSLPALQGRCHKPLEKQSCREPRPSHQKPTTESLGYPIRSPLQKT